MKYIRKVMATGLAIIFLIALVIGIGVIFSIRNVNVSFIDYSGKRSEEYAAARANLNKLKGSGLLFINDGDIYGKVSATDVLAVESYEKKFPCTVNVVIRERVESFALKTQSGYAVYDEKGVMVRTASEENGFPVSSLDACPVVLVEAQPDQMESVAEMCAFYAESFGALRRTVEKVTCGKYLGLQLATFSLRGGLTVSVSDWQNATGQKIKKAYEAYKELSDNQRVCGTINVFDGRDNSGPVAKYSLNGIKSIDITYIRLNFWFEPYFFVYYLDI